RCSGDRSADHRRNERDERDGPRSGCGQNVDARSRAIVEESHGGRDSHYGYGAPAGVTRVAVIGAGEFGKNHIRVVEESPRAELTFVVDVNPERARDFPRRLEDYRGVIGKVDAAIVAVPTVLHAEVGCALLEAGI